MSDGMFLDEASMRIDEAWVAGKAKAFRKFAVAAEKAFEGVQEAFNQLSQILFELEIALAEARICLLKKKLGPLI